jgi:hypothetical protein
MDCSCLPPFLLFNFPRKKYPEYVERMKMWIKALNSNDWRGKNWIPPRRARVCSKHFVDGQPSNINPCPVLSLGDASRIEKQPLPKKQISAMSTCTTKISVLLGMKPGQTSKIDIPKQTWTKNPGKTLVLLGTKPGQNTPTVSALNEHAKKEGNGLEKLQQAQVPSSSDYQVEASGMPGEMCDQIKKEPMDDFDDIDQETTVRHSSMM